MDKVIISDTSCLIALSKIDKLDLLRDLFREVIITREVLQEYGSLIPEWIIVTDVKNKQKQKELEKLLDKGESSSIALTLEFEKAILIIDEIRGRRIAQSLNVDIIGTLGIILLADRKALDKDVIGTVLKLVNKGFRLSDKLIDMIIEKYGKQ